MPRHLCSHWMPIGKCDACKKKEIPELHIPEWSLDATTKKAS